MFNRHTRARVPSPAALRALYQLAYISSGTAVGVAALCAEERRRRTAVLQRIADNAKRIRQSPRHIHNAATTNEETPLYWNCGNGGEWTVDENGSGDQGVIRRAAVPAAAARGPELPSAVEKGYEQVTRRVSRRMRRSAALATGYTGAHVDDSADVETQHAQSLFGAEAQSSHRDTATRKHLHQVRSSIQLHGVDNDSTKSKPTPAALKPRIPHLRDGDGNKIHPEHTVTYDVGLFLKRDPQSRRDKLLVSSRATHLLAKALECGALTEASSLISWKSVHGSLSQPDFERICSACTQLCNLESKEVVYKFYSDAFRHGNFHRIPAQTKVRLASEVVGEIMSWDLGVRRDRIVESLLGPFTQGKSLRDALNDVTRSLLNDGNLSEAVELILNIWDLDRTDVLLLADDAFDVAVRKDDLEAAHKIMQRKHIRPQIEHARMSQYEWLVRECDQRKSYWMLDDVINVLNQPKWFEWLVAGLSHQARLILATACTTQKRFPRKLFLKLSQTIPADVQSEVVHVRHSITRLEQTWGSTRDLAVVRDMFEEIEKSDSTSKLSTPAQQRILITMIEILISASQTDQAVRLLASRHPTKLERVHAVSLTMLTMARKRAWDKVNVLLDVLRRMDGVPMDQVVSRHLNELVKLFSRRHTAQQSWEFTTTLIDQFGFKPSSSTTDSLLQCFVTKRALDLVPKWLSYIRHLGLRFEVDAIVAARLLHRFVVDQRPPHEFILSIFHDLNILAPWLQCSQTADVVKGAAAFDLRKASGKNRSTIRTWAESHLDNTAFASPHYQHADRPEPSNSDMVSPPAAWKADQPTTHMHRQQRNIEMKMEIVFSRNQHSEVLRIYQESLDSNGVPVSAFALEMATESCLRLHHGNPSEAHKLLAKAREAGMNISCAMGPMLLHQMYHDNSRNKKDPDRLSAAVVKYYRTNAENGWATRHHVGVSAANILIDNRRALHGINLLNAIRQSGWAADCALDIVPMTVYIKGFSALKSFGGINWVVQQVLNNEVRIDRDFLQALKSSLKAFGCERGQKDAQLEPETSKMQRIRQLRQLCVERRIQQEQETRAFGRELIQCIIRCSKATRDSEQMGPTDQNLHL